MQPDADRRYDQVRDDEARHPDQHDAGEAVAEHSAERATGRSGGSRARLAAIGIERHRWQRVAAIASGVGGALLLLPSIPEDLHRVAGASIVLTPAHQRSEALQPGDAVPPLPMPGTRLQLTADARADLLRFNIATVSSD